MSWEWTDQQQAAMRLIIKWATTRGGPQVMRLFGWAGTGKTQLAQQIGNELGGAIYCAPTGKAALVMKKRGCYNAKTCHSLVYKAVEDLLTGKVHFELNPESLIAAYRLCICDEAGMVDDELGADMLSFGTKILAIADPFQLPPVRGDGFYTRGEPDIMLTDIRRQALDNPIIRLSMDIREGRGLTPGRYGDSLVARRRDLNKDQVRTLVDEADQTLCGRNDTRQTINSRVRELLGAPTPWPMVDDKLVCLKNNREKGLLNGGLWKVERVHPFRDAFDMMVSTDDDPDITEPIEVRTPKPFFVGEEKTLDWRARKHFDEFTYGYALTVHKAQGSAWPHVLVFDESGVFREDAPRHLYTAVTRAVERVSVLL